MLSNFVHEPIHDHVIQRGVRPGSSWPTLLIVDSDLEMAQTLVCFFERRGFHVAAAASIAEAKHLFHRRKSWTLVIADYHLPDGTGWDLSGWLQEQSDGTPLLVMSGSPHGATLCEGLEYLPKPFTLEKIEAYVRTLPQRG
jgi:DNA-binding response OmpR family regulator